MKMELIKKISTYFLVLILLFIGFLFFRTNQIDTFKMELIPKIAEANSDEFYDDIPKLSKYRWRIYNQHSQNEMLFSIRNPKNFWTEDEMQFMSGETKEIPESVKDGR